jgi:two-component system LytT family sensor kinase
MIATQAHLYQSALHLTFPDIQVSWGDSFRFPLVECLFWAVLTPSLLQLSRRFQLFGSGWVKSIVALLMANVGLELLHALYRVPLHSFVYPNMTRIPFPRLLKYYFLGNSLNDLWVFWSILVVGQFVGYYVRYVSREKELAKAQLQALTAQLQPHFLFNVLNSVSSLMRDDIEAADDMIARLSDLMRTTLKSSSPQEISLRDELEVVGTYVEIERMRFQDRLRYTVIANAQVLGASVPTFVLLPVVENAIRYAVGPRTSPGKVEVRALRDGNDLLISVIDDGPGIQPGPEFKEGIGLANTRTRLNRCYAGKGSMSYQNLQGGGFEVRFRIPFVLRETGGFL